MGVTRLEKYSVCAIYFIMAANASHLFLTGISSPRLAQFQDYKLLVGSMLVGAVALLSSAILIHFRPAKAYVTAMFALQFLALAYFPLFAPIILEILIHRSLAFDTYGVTDLLPLVLLAVIAIFTPVRLFKLANC
ncbi:MAG TPA: hypothetical protein VGJ85_08230 [Candidatus Nanopelagicaceae bacterium]|jgi:hypothetical protein